MSKRSPELLLNDILESVDKIQRYTTGITFEAFIEDSRTMDAVIRNFEIIGEAANRLPDFTKEKYPELTGTAFAAFVIASCMIIWVLIIGLFG